MRAAAVDKLTGDRIFGSKGNVAALKLPRNPIEEGDLATSGAIRPGGPWSAPASQGSSAVRPDGGSPQDCPTSPTSGDGSAVALPASSSPQGSPASNGSGTWVAAPKDESPHDRDDAWQDRTILDEHAETIGKVQEIYLDLRTGNWDWALVDTGQCDGRSHLVPLAGAYADGDAVRVRVTCDEVDDAPSVDPRGRLSGQEEEQLFAHYERPDVQEVGK